MNPAVQKAALVPAFGWLAAYDRTWLRAGLVAQRTRAYGGKRELQRRVVLAAVVFAVVVPVPMLAVLGVKLFRSLVRSRRASC